MRKTSTKPSSTVKSGAKDELPPRLSDLLVAGQTKTIATMYINNEYPEVGITKGDEIFYDAGAIPRVGDIVLKRLSSKERYVAPIIYKTPLQLATENGEKVKSFEPFPEIVGVVRFIVRPTSGGVQ